MYISGENIVVKPYTPVDAYAVMPMADGIISGGTGDDNVVVGQTRFYWVYDPLNLKASGFTGKGWFCGVPGTPLEEWTEEKLFEEFEAGRKDLNDIFAKWQEFINTTPGNWVAEFMLMIGNSACMYVGM